jgi:hypothetical protein
MEGNICTSDSENMGLDQSSKPRKGHFNVTPLAATHMSTHGEKIIQVNCVDVIEGSRMVL